MNLKVKQKFQSLEYQREYLFTLLLDAPVDKTNVRFAKNSWSIAQVYYHLYLVEQKIFDDIARRIKNHHTAGKTGMKEKLKANLLKLFLRLPLKYRAPKAVEESLPQKVNLDKLRADWDNLRHAFELLLNVNSQEHLQLKLFKHPSVGLMNIIQALDFIKEHHRHHLTQVRNLLSKIKKY